MPDDEHEPADWDKWGDMLSASLWEAVALSLDIEPESLPIDWRDADYSDPFEDCPREFGRRIAIALNHAADGALPLTSPAFTSSPFSTIRLKDFADWAGSSRGWSLPDRFPRTSNLNSSGAAAGGVRLAPAAALEAVYRTGVEGKPTSWHLIEAECRRRYKGRERHPNKSTGRESSAEWAAVLITWLQSAHPHAPQPTPKTVANRLSGLLRKLPVEEC